ncbi:unnamed protein product, partial [Tetraodon nigroviridis]
VALLGIDICGAFVDRLGERFRGYLGTGEIFLFSYITHLFFTALGLYR